MNAAYQNKLYILDKYQIQCRKLREVEEELNNQLSFLAEKITGNDDVQLWATHKDVMDEVFKQRLDLLYSLMDVEK